VALSDLRDLSAVIARCRWLLDLDADPEAIDQQLGEDPELRPLVARAPGRRVPRTVDGAEMAIRAVVGQQISTAVARTHAARLAGAAALLARAERWRPWRAYAIQHLWGATAHPINNWPPAGRAVASARGGAVAA
jgi:3-methyladenine DNA glycosylase/8-oxoguanine DNA glycosylase